MQIQTEDDFSEMAINHAWSSHFSVLLYSGGGQSVIPIDFFRDWLDQNAMSIDANFYIGRCSGVEIGSVVRYEGLHQSLRIGRFVSGGARLAFLLNGQHDSKNISTYMFSIAGMGMNNSSPPQYSDSVIKNDVWIGDETMMLGGGIIENGCIIGARSLLPPNFRSEPYGVYAGSPARLLHFRFSEKIRTALLDLAWWDKPMSWIKANNAIFLMDLTADEDKSLEAIVDLKKKSITDVEKFL